MPHTLRTLGNCIGCALVRVHGHARLKKGMKIVPHGPWSHFELAICKCARSSKMSSMRVASASLNFNKDLDDMTSSRVSPATCAPQREGDESSRGKRYAGGFA